MASFIITLGIVGIVATIGFISKYYLGKDNPVEEECEKIIEDETGKKIDLSGPDATNEPAK
jgi:hypothetical protein